VYIATIYGTINEIVSKGCCPGRKVRWGVRRMITGYLWMRCFIAIELGFRGATCLNDSAILAWCIRGSAAGPNGEFGRSFLSIWRRMQTMNTR